MQIASYNNLKFVCVCLYLGGRGGEAVELQQQWMAHQNALVIHVIHPSQELSWELWKQAVLMVYAQQPTWSSAHQAAKRN